LQDLWKEFVLTLLRGQPVFCFSRVLVALKEQGNKMQAEAVNNLQNYLEEPEGQYLLPCSHDLRGKRKKLNLI
jgi:hypothetical protein